MDHFLIRVNIDIIPLCYPSKVVVIIAFLSTKLEEYRHELN